MIDVLEAENTKETWMLRGAGALLLWFGIMMVLRPISVVADFIPLVGSIAGFGTAVAAFLLAAVFGLGTIAVSWVAHRPLVGVPLLVATLGFAVLLLRRARKRS
jgi:hypothetical protein